MLLNGTEDPACEALAQRIALDRTSPLPLGRQLYLALYGAITRGELPRDHLLPPGRVLAHRLAVGRNTVLDAYAGLSADGLVHAAGRRGTRVCHSLVFSEPKSPVPDWSLSLRASAAGDGMLRPLALSPGEPDAELFPAAARQRAMARAARLPAAELGYRSEVALRLQVAIARHLALFRSLVVDPGQIIVTSSTRQSLMLAASLYTDAGERASVECPAWPGAIDALRNQGLQLEPLEIDRDGARPVALSGASLIYLTPCFQYPLGSSLSPARREAFLTLSAQHGSVIFEDDYDSEFRDDVVPLPALASEARAGARVLHAGTCSKLIFPAARVAWLVVPLAHAARARSTLRAIGGGHGTITQAAVCEVFERGVVSTHLERARAVYARRRRVWRDAISRSSRLSDAGGGGLCAQLSLDRPVALRALERALGKAGIGALPLERFDWRRCDPRATRTLVAGLGNVASLELPGVIAALERAVASCR